MGTAVTLRVLDSQGQDDPSRSGGVGGSCQRAGRGDCRCGPPHPLPTGHERAGPRTGRIQRANLDGSAVEDLITTGLISPKDIALDLTAAATPTPTPTSTATLTPTPTGTATPTPTPTSLPTSTPTPTPTVTSSPTSTPTVTPTSTPVSFHVYLPIILKGG